MWSYLYSLWSAKGNSLSSIEIEINLLLAQIGRLSNIRKGTQYLAIIDSIYQNCSLLPLMIRALEREEPIEILTLTSSKFPISKSYLGLIFPENLKNNAIRALTPLHEILIRVKTKQISADLGVLNLDTMRRTSAKKYIRFDQDLMVGSNILSEKLFSLFLTFIRKVKDSSGIRVIAPLSLRERIWNESDGTCYACSKTLLNEKWELGHLKSVAEGGLTVPENLCVLCFTCNHKMGRMHVVEFMIRNKFSLQKVSISEIETWTAILVLTERTKIQKDELFL